MITDTATTPRAAPELEDGVEVEVIVTGDGCLTLIWPNGQTVEVPLTKDDAVMLVAALCEFAYPGHRLASAPAGGHA